MVVSVVKWEGVGKNKFGNTDTLVYFSAMKVNVKIDEAVVGKVKRHIKKSGQMIGTFFELAANQSLTPQYHVMDNSNAFRKYLDDKKIEYKGAGHATIIIGHGDPVGLGTDWGIFKALNDPAYKTNVKP